MARDWKHIIAAVAVFFLIAVAVDVTIYSTPSIADLHPVRRLQDRSGGGQDILTPIIWICWFIGDIIFMFIYKNKVVDKIPTLPSKEGGGNAEFDGGICDCWSDCDLCMHVWCCLGCRQAHNWQVAGVMDYYCAIAVQVLAYFVNSFFCMGFFILAHFHGQVKVKRGIQPDCCCDCCCLMWCEPCVVARAALSLDRDCGVKVRCCCQLEQTGTAASPVVMGAVVGQPVVGQVVTVAGPQQQKET